MKIQVPRLAQPLFRESSELKPTFIGLIRSVDTIPVETRDSFRVVVKDITTRKRLIFDLTQDNWNTEGFYWVVSAGITGEIQ